MKLKISVIKDGRELMTEVLENPKEANLTDAIDHVYHKARIYTQGPLWPFQIEVREVAR
jgi:hypothetical protein